ncbi:molybdopterin-dependent oxidoreductase [Azospirillum sp.]|uniref:nitrate reductase n=1 Tax=Azospirillum sp. TaxID=34012 RepID=UPI003D733CB9
MAEPVRTTCPYCGVGCGVLAEAGADGTVAVRGDPDHPANRGRLCSKGMALGETLGLHGRLLTPEVNGRAVDWDTALDTVAAGFRAAIERHGPDSVAFYISGQLLTEDYYAVNKLMKGFVGSANVDTNSRLCMASTVAGHKRAFGADVVPGCYEDLDTCDLAVLVGSNAAWCHPILHRRLEAARARGARIVVIDPRRTATCDSADLHLALRPGSDVLLFNGLLAHLVRSGAIDGEFLSAYTKGFADALAAAERDAPDLDAVAAGCGLRATDVARFFRWFAATERTVTLFSQGVNQSSQGTDKVNAILNVHLASGRIGKPGMGPFSLTGQPNAMGGREVGGLANQLAAHMGFDDPADVERVGRFWNAPAMAAKPGLKAVDLFQAVAEGRIKALWIMATNPAVSLPDADAVRAALAACPFVVVSDAVRATDTTAHAHVLLPASAWGEKDGTVTNSERRISRQRALRPSPGAAMPDWWQVAQVGRRLGWGEAFAWRSSADIFREHAALSAFENHGTRAFDLGPLAGLTDAAYDALEPVQWPVRALNGEIGGTARLFADGTFVTPDGRARLVPVRVKRPAHVVSVEHPFILNTGRLRDQWHTMTRTGMVPRLASHTDEPFVAIHPDDAAEQDLTDGDLAIVAGPPGRAVLRVRVTGDQAPGTLFAPIHWSRRFASEGGVGPLLPAATDPVSGQPELKHGPVSVRRWAPAWTGFLVGRADVVPDADWWVGTVRDGCRVTLLAGDAWPADLEGWAARLLGGEARLDLHDGGRGVHRWARLDGDRLEAVLFLGTDGPQRPCDWLVARFAEPSVPAEERPWLLSGQAPSGATGCGRVLCACWNVAEARVRTAVEAGLTTVQEIGAALKAGTGCGSCVPEIKELIADARHDVAA